ncbi:hypothetical protein CKJ89_39095, partial [Klebsiella pneumoniae]
SKRNLMLFIRPTIIAIVDEYRQASSGQYTAFNNAQTKLSKRNLMLFIRPTIIAIVDEYRQASSGQYTAFN